MRTIIGTPVGPRVLFRENSTNHNLEYAARSSDGTIFTTRTRALALEFESSREAYEFGEAHKPKLDAFKAGVRY